MKLSHNHLVRLIAAFKLMKAILLIAVGVGAFKLLHRNITDVIEHAVRSLRLDPGNHLIDATIGKAANLNPQQIKKLGLGSFLYAGLFFTEGSGLWFLKRWAEWVTVLITGSLIPIEIYEIHHRPGAVKWIILALNLSIVLYLVYRIRSHPAASE